MLHAREYEWRETAVSKSEILQSFYDFMIRPDCWITALEPDNHYKMQRIQRPIIAKRTGKSYYPWTLQLEDKSHIKHAAGAGYIT